VGGESDALFGEANGPAEPDAAPIELEILPPTGDDALDLFQHPRAAAGLIGGPLFAPDEPFSVKNGEGEFSATDVNGQGFQITGRRHWHSLLQAGIATGFQKLTEILGERRVCRSMRRECGQQDLV
jgi:hypothetical protein